MNAVSPYIGLRSFQPEEADIFFGRDDEINSLLRKLEENRFVAVLGDSGSGKSSLVRAGLIPVVHSGVFADTEEGWQIAEMRPGTDPVRHLADALLKNTDWGSNYKKGMEKDVDPRDHLVNDLNTGIDSLLELLQEQPLKLQTRLLILVDQFEELFGDDDNDKDEKKSEKEQFVRQLLTGVTSKLSRVHVVITMRSDFIGKCSGYDDLPEAINKGLFLVPKMKPMQIIDAIASPAKRRGAEVEPELINYLLNNILEKGNSDQKKDNKIILEDRLPLLQHALMLIWNKEEKSTDGSVLRLRLKTFKKLEKGTLKSVLENHLEQIWSNELDRNEKDLAEILFRELTETDDRDRNVRRMAKLREIADVAEVSWHQLAKVVEKFQRPGCDFLRIQPQSDKNDLNADTNIDITHECIIRQWKRLKNWVENEVEKAGRFKKLLNKADNWNDSPGDLLTGMKLDNAIAWLRDFNPTSNWAKRYENKYKKKDEKDKSGSTLEDVKWFIEKSRLKQEDEVQSKLRTAILSTDPDTILSLIVKKRVRLQQDQINKLLNNDTFYYALLPDEITSKKQPQRKEFCSKPQAGIENVFDKSSQENSNLKEKIEEYFTKENIFDNEGNERTLRNNFTVQHYAALNGQTEVLKRLLKLRANIKVQSEGGSTLFHWAALGGKEKTMEWLLRQYGSDKKSIVNMHTTSKKETALHFAAGLGHKAVVQKLLVWRAKIDAENSDKVTPLMFAIFNRQKETIETLIKKGANLLKEGYQSRTPLMAALVYSPKKSATYNLKDIVQLLLDHGSGPNEIYTPTKESVLQIAISNGHAEVAELLYNNGAKFDHKDKEGNTPLITALIAISNDKNSDLEKFTERLINDIPEDSDIISKALMYASAVDSTWAKRLLEKGANPNFEEENKNTPLFIAAAFGKIDCIKLLLEEKVSTDCINNEKQTALHLATKGGYRNAIDLLLESTSIDPNARDRNHETALHYAARANCLDIIERLLKEDKIEKEPRNKMWQTPLHIAAIADNTAAVWTLLNSSMSFEVDPKDLNGNTPMAYALNNEDEDFRTAVTLRKAGAKLSLWAKEIKNIIGIDKMKGEDLRNKFEHDIQSGTEENWPFLSLIDGNWEDVPTAEAVEALIKVRMRKEFPLGLGVGCTAVAKVRKRKIDFYEDAWLYEAMFLSDEKCAGYLTFIQHQHGYTLLNGTSPPIHKMNAELPLQIDTQDRATDYFRFFCASVHGDVDAGAFRIFENPTQLLPTEDMPSEFIMKIEKESIPIKLEYTNEASKKQGWNTEIAVKYGNTLFKSKFFIPLNGTVEMIEDVGMYAELNVYSEVFKNGLRMLHLPSSHKSSLCKYYIENDLPLHLAALENQPREIERLLQKSETDPKKRDKDQSTVLHVAVESGSSTVVDQLLENKNIEINPINTFGHTPLTLAVKTGQDEIVNKLLNKDAKLPIWSETIRDTHSQKKEFYWLEGNSLKGKILKDLESKETEVWPFLPLINGVWESVPISEAIEALIGMRETIPGLCLGCTSIIAVRKLKVEFYEDAWLYEGLVLSDEKCAGYLTFIQHQYGYTLLDGTFPTIYRMNAELPLQIDTQERATDYLRFFCASVHGYEGTLRIFENQTQLLQTDDMSSDEIMKIRKLSDPIKLERANEAGKEPGWNTEVVVKYGNTGNTLSKTLFFIPLNGKTQMIKNMKVVTGLNMQNEVFGNGLRMLYLSNSNRPLKIFTEEDLPLHFAAFRNQPGEIVNLLQNPEIDPNKRGIDQSTTLHIAVKSDSSSVVDRLLENENIKIDPYNALGHTPLTLAAKTDHDEIANKLLKKGAKLPLWSEIISDSNLQKIHWLEGNSLKEKIRKDLESKEAEIWPFISLTSGCWEDVPTIEAVEVLTEIGKELPSGLGVSCTAVAKARKLKIDFYEDAWLYEGLVLSDEECAGYLTFIQHQYGYTLLDGTSPQIHQLNDELPIRLSKNNVYDYLKFFCTFVHGDEGAFNIIDEIDQIHWLDAAEKNRLKPFILVVLDKECTGPEEKNEDSNVFWSCRAFVKHSNMLFLTDFKINKSGMVEMLNDIPIITNLSTNLEIFEDGLRTYRGKRPKEDEKLKLLLSFIDAAEEGLLGVMKWQLKQDKDLNINAMTKCPEKKDTKNEESNDEEVYGKTALRLATENVHIHVVEWLLSLEAIKDHETSDGKTAQDVANESNNKELINLFQNFNQKPTT